MRSPGRPRGPESRRRVKHMLELLAGGHSLPDAAANAGVDARRVLGELESDLGFRGAVFALLDERRKAA